MTPDLVVGPAGFVRRLLLRGERAAVGLPLRRTKAPGGSARLRFIADAVRKDALGWLVRAGGWQRRAVVVAGRRREGRVTDAGVFERLGVRFTPAPLGLLVAAMESPPPLPPLDARLRALCEQGLRAPDPATGDLLALHRIVEQLGQAAEAKRVEAGVDTSSLRGPIGAVRQATGGRWAAVVTPDGRLLASAGEVTQADLPPIDPVRPGKSAVFQQLEDGIHGRSLEPARAWLIVAVGTAPQLEAPAAQTAVNKLRQAVIDAGHQARRDSASRRRELERLSPLTLLFRPEALGDASDVDPRPGDDAAAEALAARRVAPLLAGDRAVLLTYLDRALARSWLDEEAARRAMPAVEAQPRWIAAGHGLGGLVRAAAAAGRPDALRPALRFFEGYIGRFGARVPVVEALREQSRTLDRASERDAFLAAAGGLFSVGRAVRAVIEHTLNTPVVDRGEEEKALLGDWHDGFKAIADECEAIRRELMGEVG